jgi:GDP-D-mannose dehydratase
LLRVFLSGIEDIITASTLLVMIDCDDGYGDAKNVTRTVLSYTKMGASALSLKIRWHRNDVENPGPSVLHFFPKKQNTLRRLEMNNNFVRPGSECYIGLK